MVKMVQMVYDGRGVPFGVGCLYLILHSYILLLLTYTLANYSV